MSTLCASCTSIDYSKPIKSSPNKKPQWLDEKDYVEEFIANYPNCTIKKQKTYDQTMTLNLGKKHANKRILYWAANPSDSLIIQDAKKAYGHFENHGVARVNHEGMAKVHFQTPQAYSTIEKGKSEPNTFYRHLHFVYSDMECKQWLTTLYTNIVICERDYYDVCDSMKKGSYVLINALPSEYYAQDHIPNSYNLHYTAVRKMGLKKMYDWMALVVKLHYPKLQLLLDRNQIHLSEVPIICYCANTECDAAYKCVIELYKKGFVRVEEYKGGMKDYNAKTKK